MTNNNYRKEWDRLKRKIYTKNKSRIKSIQNRYFGGSVEEKKWVPST